MIRRLLTSLLWISVASAGAQIPYGNEWIDHSRQYWRFQVQADRLCRIDSAALAAAGFPIATVDPADIMIYGREKQIPLFIQGGDDGVLNTGDFIEFFAEMNSGWLDALMYPTPAAQANPYYSLYNDTIRYFITWDPDASKERIATHSATNWDDHVPLDWYWGETISQIPTTYYQGLRDPITGVSSGAMVEGEGWFHNATMTATSGNPMVEQVHNLAMPRLYSGTGAPDAQVFTSSAAQNNPGGMSYDDHHLQLEYDPGGVLMVDTIFRGAKVIKTQFTVPNAALTGTLPIRFKVLNDLFGPGQVGSATLEYSDIQVVSNLGVRYPKDFNLQGLNILRMWLPNAEPAVDSRIDFYSFAGSPVLYVWNADSVRRIEPTFISGVWRAIVPPDITSDATAMIALNSLWPNNITSIVPVNGNGYFTDFAAMDLDSALLVVAHATLMNAADQYAAYRQSNPYNPMNTVVADVDELYDQFGGGIPKHAFAIRRWCKFLLDEWNTRPQGLFLIGKSVQTPRINFALPGIRPDSQGAYARCLIPTYGYPSSDPSFTIGLLGDPRRMEIPVGRLSATSEVDVYNYLSKVQALEAQPRGAWMKNILHFRGGFNANENQLFGAYMEQMAQAVRDTCFGGNVINFVKTSSEIFQQAAADSVRYFIEDEGVTVLNFFAHAYASGFDITIDDPANYDWNGKHPLVIGNSCYVGNIHLNGTFSTSEKWVMLPDKGPIAFLSTVDVGIAQYLAPYSIKFYTSFGQVNYGGPIGKHMQYAIYEQLVNTGNLNAVNNAHTFTLEGDPMLVLNSPKLPDYSVDYEDIFFAPEPVSADADTFLVKSVVTNIGKAVNKQFNVVLERTNPGLDPSVTEYLTTLSNVYLRDTAIFHVPTQGFSGGQGVNQLQVRVDLDPDQVPEMEDLTNNVTNTTLFITSGDLVPAYPYDYAILPEPTPLLKASTGDPFAPERNYVFQIDTTDLFNSPILESTMISAPGGVISWQPTSIYTLNSVQDSTVFFWRCSIDSTGNGGYNWYERSFQYITGERGWGQAHYFQYKKDNYSGVIYDRPERDFDFFQGLRNIRARVQGNVSNNNTEWALDLQPQEYNGCNLTPAWHVAIIDPTTFIPWGTKWTNSSGVTFNPNNNFGNQNNENNCRNRVELVFTFRTDDPGNMTGLQNLIENVVPDGHHMMFFTWLRLNKVGMAANAPGLMPAMEALGAPSFSTIPDSVPYIFYVQKGDPTTFQSVLGDTLTSTINLSVWVETAFSQGTITTMNAGPAYSWDALYWNSLPMSPGDSTRIKVIGIPFNASPSDPGVLLLDLPAEQDSVPDLGLLVDAQQYPMLRLEGAFHDLGSITPVPAQMERWQLLSAPVPECAIDPPLGYLNALNDLYQGQDARVAVAVRNISEFDMDSLLVAAWVIDRNNVRHLLHYKVGPPLLTDGVRIDTIQFSTNGLGGPNTLVIEANPVDTATGVYHQLEQYHFNNIAQIRFDVAVDRENPLLDVTFDGVHILDGDVVSAKPEIEITLDDENTVLLLDQPTDTASFRVFLSGPGIPLQRVYFRDGAGQEIMQFIPANGPANKARAIYRPHFVTDGKYTLSIQAWDRSNNFSGDQDRRITFEVINRPTITEVLNYPNPFTTNTRFVFTITGSQPPTYMKIQIMTVTGRVVREVKMHELGPLRVGRNMTEFAWDGTDEFGDRLARGVYLYRVIAQLNGQDIEYRETGASEYFNKGFGKMYLLR